MSERLLRKNAQQSDTVGSTSPTSVVRSAEQRPTTSNSFSSSPAASSQPLSFSSPHRPKSITLLKQRHKDNGLRHRVQKIKGTLSPRTKVPKNHDGTGDATIFSSSSSSSSSSSVAEETVTHLYDVLNAADRTTQKIARLEEETREEEERLRYAERYQALSKLPLTKAKMWSQVLTLRDQIQATRQENATLTAKVKEMEKGHKHTQHLYNEVCMRNEKLKQEIEIVREAHLEDRKLREKRWDARLQAQQSEVQRLRRQHKETLTELRREQEEEKSRLQVELSSIQTKKEEETNNLRQDILVLSDGLEKYRDLYSQCQLQLLEIQRGLPPSTF